METNTQNFNRHLKAELLSGEVKEYESSNSEEGNVATAGSMKEHSGKTIFYIMLNAKLIYSAKSIHAFGNKWCALVEKYNLEPAA